MTPKVPLRHYMLMERRRQLLEEICPFWDTTWCMLCLNCPKHLLTLYTGPLSIDWAAKGPIPMCMAYTGHVNTTPIPLQRTIPSDCLVSLYV